MPSAATVAQTVFVLSLVCAGIFCSLDLACASPAKMLHNSQNLGTKYGTWGEGYTCETCHEQTLAAKNIKKVKSNVATRTGVRPVAFNRYTGRSNDATGVFGNDERTLNAEASRNICEVCHHLTAYHQYSASKIADKKHTEHKSNLRDCTSCHRHNVGYKPPSSQECDVCHGYPPVNNGYYGGPAGMVSPPTLALGGDESVPPANVGAHDKHRNVLGFECQVCHNSYEHGYAGNDMIEFGFRIDQSTWPPFTGVVANGEITATNAPSFRGQFAVAPGNAGTTLMRAPDVMTCNVYCHGGFWNYDSGGTGSAVSWVQGPLGSCDASSCHGTTRSTTPTPVIMGNVSTGAHKTHVGKLGNDGNRCASCHDDYSSSGRHMVNGHVKVNLSSQSPSATYKGFNQMSTAYLAATGAYGSCSNLYCHSNVQTPDGTATASSFTTVTWGGDRTGCDGCHGGVRTDVSPIATGAHVRHVAAYAIGCGDCHNEAGNDLPTRHADTSIDVAFGGTLGGSYSQAVNTPGNGFGSCSANYCHSDGNGITTTVGWGAGTQSCTGCHKADLASGVPIDTGSHSQHVDQAAVIGKNLNCAECHANTVNSGMTVSTISNHVNRFKDFSGSLAGRTKTACNSAYCHSDGKGGGGRAVDWSTGPALGCDGCHGADSAPIFESVAGEPNYANTGAGTPRANSHQRHMGGKGATSCIFCHSDTVDASGALTASTLHLDTVRSVAAGGGRSFSYDPATRTCSTISCHGGPYPAEWGESFPSDCTGCHGGNAGATTIIATGKHTSHVNNAAVLGDNFGCAECHSKTVSADRVVSTSANHGNSFADFSGSRAGGSLAYAAGICSATYCHSDGKGTQKSMIAAGWASTATMLCTGCHGSDASPAFTSQAGEPNYANAGAGVLRANSHQSHASAGVGSCDTCHTATVTTDGTAIKPGSLHLNREMDVSFNVAKATAVWNGLNRTCSNISCHNGGNATWGDPTSAGCAVCHPSLSGAHSAHIGDLMSAGMVAMYNYTANRSSGSVYRYGCANCHPTDTSKHRNGQVDITLNKNKAGGSFQVSLNSLVTTDTGGYTSGGPDSFTCELAYCHSNGKSTTQIAADYRQSPNWYGGAFSGNRCGMCHDNPPQYAGQSHYVADSTLGDNGRGTAWESGHMVGIHFRNTSRGNKQNGFLGYSSSGNMAHGNPAYSTAITCSLCHNGVVSSTQIDTYAMHGTASKFRCENCHTPESRTPLQPGRIIDASLHINGAKDVAFAPVSVKTKAQLSNVANALGWGRQGTYKGADSYDSFDLSVSTWDPQTKTCLTACHVNQPGITWGAGLQCFSCHANQ